VREVLDTTAPPDPLLDLLTFFVRMEQPVLTLIVSSDLIALPATSSPPPPSLSRPTWSASTAPRVRIHYEIVNKIDPAKEEILGSKCKQSSNSWILSFDLLGYPTHITINMPALSPTMTHGNIGTWQKKVGDVIAPGDVLVEIETDKAQMDFECQEDGYIAKILADSGSKDVDINRPIAIMVENKEDIEKFADFTVADVEGAAAPAAAEKKEEAPKAEAPKAEATKSTESASAAPSRSDAGNLLFAIEE